MKSFIFETLRSFTVFSLSLALLFYIRYGINEDVYECLQISMISAVSLLVFLSLNKLINKSIGLL